MGEAEERNQAKLLHIVNGFVPVLGGLIFWMTGKDRSTFVDDQGKEAVNFGISLAAAQIAIWIFSFIIAVVTLGLGSFLFLLGIAVWIYGIVMGFQAGARAEQGEHYRYPINPLRLIK